MPATKADARQAYELETRCPAMHGGTHTQEYLHWLEELAVEALEYREAANEIEQEDGFPFTAYERALMECRGEIMSRYNGPDDDDAA